MVYNENSFLQGIAVGRALKGVTVTSQNPAANSFHVQSMHIALGSWISPQPTTVPGLQASELAVNPLVWDLSGELIEAATTAASDLGIGSLNATAQLTIISE